MKMSDNPAKHEVLIEIYLRSILDISVKYMFTIFFNKSNDNYDACF